MEMAMSERVTLELPEELIRRARAIAAETSRPLEEVLVDWSGRAVTTASQGSFAQDLLGQGPTGGEDGPEPARHWRYLVVRPHPRRKQLTIPGRNLTVGQLVSTIRANRYSVEEAASNLELPQEVIEEALVYYEENRDLIEAEAAAERHWLAERGYPLEPHDLPR
jgi:uncharacterized protein (DUF433 family)